VYGTFIPDISDHSLLYNLIVVNTHWRRMLKWISSLSVMSGEDNDMRDHEPWDIYAGLGHAFPLMELWVLEA